MSTKLLRATWWIIYLNGSLYLGIFLSLTLQFKILLLLLYILLLLFKMWGSGSVRRSARLLLQPSQLASRWIFQFLFCEIVLNQRNNTKKRQCQNARFEVERLGIRSCHLPSDSQCSHSYCWHWFGYKRSFFSFFGFISIFLPVSIFRSYSQLNDKFIWEMVVV